MRFWRNCVCPFARYDKGAIRRIQILRFSLDRLKEFLKKSNCGSWISSMHNVILAAQEWRAQGVMSGHLGDTLESSETLWDTLGTLRGCFLGTFWRALGRSEDVLRVLWACSADALRHSGDTLESSGTLWGSRRALGHFGARLGKHLKWEILLQFYIHEFQKPAQAVRCYVYQGSRITWLCRDCHCGCTWIKDEKWWFQTKQKWHELEMTKVRN